MAAYNKFNKFVQDVTNKVHNIGSDQLTIALTDVAPVATNAVLADLTQISYTNLSARNLTTTSNTQTSGTDKLIVADLTLTASGTVAQFRYVVLYNSTAAGGPLIAWYDYGSEINMTNGQTFLISLGGSSGVFTLT